MENKLYLYLAKTVRWFHVLWIVSMLVIASLAMKWTFLLPISMAITLTTIISQVIWKGCPLVLLENTLHKKYDPEHEITGSFLAKGIRELFSVDVPTWLIFSQLVLLFVITLIINLLIIFPQ